MATYKETAHPPLTDDDRAVPPPGRMGRVTKSQMNVSLPLEMHERLREIAWEHRQPLSHVVRALIAAGMQAHKVYRAAEPAHNGVDEDTQGL